MRENVNFFLIANYSTFCISLVELNCIGGLGCTKNFLVANQEHDQRMTALEVRQSLAFAFKLSQKRRIKI